MAVPHYESKGVLGKGKHEAELWVPLVAFSRTTSLSLQERQANCGVGLARRCPQNVIM